MKTPGHEACGTNKEPPPRGDWGEMWEIEPLRCHYMHDQVSQNQTPTFIPYRRQNVVLTFQDEIVQPWGWGLVPKFFRTTLLPGGAQSQHVGAWSWNFRTTFRRRSVVLVGVWSCDTQLTRGWPAPVWLGSDPQASLGVICSRKSTRVRLAGGRSGATSPLVWSAF